MSVIAKRGRDRLYIIAEILDIAKDSAFKTQIMYKANLSFSQLNEYLDFLLKLNLLECKKTEGKIVYKTTEKGLKYLNNYREILDLIVSQKVHWKSANNLTKIRGNMQKLKMIVSDLETNLTQTIKCPYCKEEIFADYNFCPYCGKKLETESLRSVVKR